MLSPNDLDPNVADDAPIEARLVLSSRTRAERAADAKAMTDWALRLRETKSAGPELGAPPTCAPTGEDVEAARRFAARHGLTARCGARDVTLSGPAAAFRAAFGVDLRWEGEGASRYRVQVGAARLPDDLADRVVAVVGLDRRPIARPLATLAPVSQLEVMPLPGRSTALDLHTALDLLPLYDFPKGLDGAGQKVGIVLPGGGLPVEVLGPYFDALGLPEPTVEIVNVSGAENTPSDLADIRDFMLAWKLGQTSDEPLPKKGARAFANGAIAPDHVQEGPTLDVDLLFTIEALMSVELIGALAGGASIVVYRTPADLLGLSEAIQQAAADRVTVLSIPWGNAESNMADMSGAIEEALAAAAAAGVTILCASGDAGSTPNSLTPDTLEATYPASSPHVIGCGGTQLRWPRNGRPATEQVWNERAFGRRVASGGGHSRFVTTRGVPDLAASASWQSGLWLWLGKVNTVAMGTSAATPILAALFARIKQGLPRNEGHLTHHLYRPDVIKRAMFPITAGHNMTTARARQYRAGPDWDACSGVGRPIGSKLLAELRRITDPTVRVKVA